MRATLPQRPLDVDVYTLALERVAHTLDEFDTVAVAFSGGKDSTAVLNTVLEVCHSDPRYERHLPLLVFSSDEEAIPVETSDYLRRVSQRDDVDFRWLCLPFRLGNACSRKSPWWWPWAPEAKDRWCRPMPDEGITEWPGFVSDPPEARMSLPNFNGLVIPPERGNGCIFMGIRAQESLIRRRAVTRRKIDNYIVKHDQGASRGNLWKSYPVYDWTTEDVWTAPAIKGWDYNRAYDRMEMAGVPAHSQRCSPAFGREPLQKLHLYAQCFPEVWDKMVERVPGAAAAARYARTELYSFRSLPDKPAGMPWPAFVREQVEKHEGAQRAEIAARIKAEVAEHYAATSQPIAPTAPHPDSGISWSFLLMLAIRGDHLHRKQAGGRIVTLDDGSGRALPRFWHRYVHELADVVDAGAFGELGHPRPAPRDIAGLVPEYARETS